MIKVSCCLLFRSGVGVLYTGTEEIDVDMVLVLSGDEPTFSVLVGVVEVGIGDDVEDSKKGVEVEYGMVEIVLVNVIDCDVADFEVAEFDKVVRDVMEEVIRDKLCEVTVVVVASSKAAAPAARGSTPFFGANRLGTERALPGPGRVGPASDVGICRLSKHARSVGRLYFMS